MVNGEPGVDMTALASYVEQSDALLGVLSVRETVRFAARLRYILCATCLPPEISLTCLPKPGPFDIDGRNRRPCLLCHYGTRPDRCDEQSHWERCATWNLRRPEAASHDRLCIGNNASNSSSRRADKWIRQSDQQRSVSCKCVSVFLRPEYTNFTSHMLFFSSEHRA